ncbi:TPA: DNA translocase FtsK [Serratia fonticola]|uniref:DNA translocase FtsK n=1 Tax=Serratia fonticola TaxID=47917 RepID=UPI0028DC4824|nr:DNA translocase FtsK [Serratia fonticola]
MERGTEPKESGGVNEDGCEFADDDLYPDAVKFVQRVGRASISGVQREFRIGYNRAARLIEQMEHKRVVSTPGHDGSRTVLSQGGEQ